MRTFIESLKRLYFKKFITIVYLDMLKENGKITEDEHTYIVAEGA